MIKPTINLDLCTNCGLCVELCGYMDATLGHNVGFTDECIGCGHCVAVCPEEAVSIPELGASMPVKEVCGIEELENLLKTRRSVRRYKKKPVSAKVLNQLINAASQAPSGCNSRSPHITIITNKKELRFIEHTFGKIIKTFAKITTSKPVSTVFKHIPLSFIQRAADPHLVAGARSMARNLKKEHPFVTLGAPVLMLFHANRSRPTPGPDCVIAAYHVVLAAHAMGLGTCFNGNITELMSFRIFAKRFRIPANSQVYAAVSLGYPAVRFVRTAPRKPFPVTIID